MPLNDSYEPTRQWPTQEELFNATDAEIEAFFEGSNLSIPARAEVEFLRMRGTRQNLDVIAAQHRARQDGESGEAQRLRRRCENQLTAKCQKRIESDIEQMARVVDSIVAQAEAGGMPSGPQMEV